MPFSICIQIHQSRSRRNEFPIQNVRKHWSVNCRQAFRHMSPTCFVFEIVSLFENVFDMRLKNEIGRWCFIHLVDRYLCLRVFNDTDIISQTGHDVNPKLLTTLDYSNAADCRTARRAPVVELRRIKTCLRFFLANSYTSLCFSS